MSTEIHAQVPDQLWQQAQTLIDRGWAVSMQELLKEALRRYLETHSETLTEQYILEDVQWGLHGKD